jgi:hypothetical protein
MADHIYITTITIVPKIEYVDELYEFINSDAITNSIPIYNPGWFLTIVPDISENIRAIPGKFISYNRVKNLFTITLYGYMTNLSGRINAPENIMRNKSILKQWCRINKDKLHDTHFGAFIAKYF